MSMAWSEDSVQAFLVNEGISKINGNLHVSLRMAASAAMRTMFGVGSRSGTAIKSSL